MNMVNIFGGFSATGIFPINPLAIPAEAFGSSKTSVLASVTCSASEVPSADKMPVSIEQPTQSSLSVPEDIPEVLQLPTVVKEPAQRKTKKVFGARCVTENEIINKIRQKGGKNKDQIEKQNFKKEREEKKSRKRRKN